MALDRYKIEVVFLNWQDEVVTHTMVVTHQTSADIERTMRSIATSGLAYGVEPGHLVLIPGSRILEIHSFAQ